jgi:hypothetical protein
MLKQMLLLRRKTDQPSILQRLRGHWHMDEENHAVWVLNTCALAQEAADEIDRLEEALAKLRYSIVQWNNTNGMMHDLREEVMALLDAYFPGTEPNYHIVDQIIGTWTVKYEAMDQILYDVIPEDEWGIILD